RADRRGEHPPKLRRAQPPIVDVPQEVDVVVPVHEAVLQRRQEGSKGNEGYKQGDQPVDPATSGSGDHGTIHGWTCLHRGMGGLRRLTSEPFQVGRDGCVRLATLVLVPPWSEVQRIRSASERI